ncbi:hypothetical protein EZV62_013657 [Acer yangbiense]|uniref:Reverse transcriptase Ty1/copia-type domain-containing protein n=1 Tax=Acer yangbiense TaxID=1000413 RepID=A0A5C7HZZ3_9ROSI|nr:hypothetical protein EZV62_013657 [Acer yangbiense]
MLEDIGYLACKPASVPMDPKVQLSDVDGDLLTDISQYKRLIGRLLYLTLSRLDVRKLSQFLAQPRLPRLPHLKAAHHLLRYLKSNPDPTGKPDSTEALLRAISDAFNGPSEGSLMDGIGNVSGDD